MIARALVLAVLLAAVGAGANAGSKRGKPGIMAAPCPDQAWSAGPYEEAIPFDGRFERPVLTLHGSGDLYVPISLEQSLRRTVDAAKSSSWLVQRIVRSPGHCNFSAEQQAAAFDALVAWARSGKRPEGDEVLGDLTNAGMKFTNPLRPGDPGVTRVSSGPR